jgi:hypothetical protein
VLGARVLPGEAIFNRGLLLPQPIEIVIQVVFCKSRQAEDITDGMGPCSAHGGEPGALVNDPCDHLP